MKTRSLWSGLSIVAALLLLTGTALIPIVSAQDTVNIVIMAGPNELSEADLAILAETYPNMTIERIDLDRTRLAAMVAAGDPPDIISASGADTPVFAENGWVMDLTDRFEASEVLRPEDMVPAVDYFRYEGGWYGMNKDWSPDQSFFISRSAAEAAGIELPPPNTLITYAQAGEWARELTITEGGRITRVGMAYSGYWDATVQTILMETGEELYAEDFSSANIAGNQTVVDFLTFMAGLAQDNAIFNPLNPSPEWVVPDLMNGRAASATNGYWIQGGFRGTVDPVITPDDYIMYPALSWGGEVIVNPALGGSGWFITANTDHPDEAWALFETFMGGELAVNRARNGWGLPALRSLYGEIPTPEVWQQQFVEAVQWEQDNTVQTPRRINPYYNTEVFNSIWNANLERYLRGEITIEEAIADLDAEVNAAITAGMSTAG